MGAMPRRAIHAGRFGEALIRYATSRDPRRDATPSDATPVEAKRDGEANDGEGAEEIP